jgi:ribosomal protein L37E
MPFFLFSLARKLKNYMSFCCEDCGGAVHLASSKLCVKCGVGASEREQKILSGPPPKRLRREPGDTHAAKKTTLLARGDPSWQPTNSAGAGGGSAGGPAVSTS